MRAIADNFVTDAASPEAIAVGLNSIREIVARCPYAVSDELLEDLFQYTSYRHRNVVSAARSLITLFRTLDPSRLPKKLRGRPVGGQGNGNDVYWAEAIF